MEKRASDGSYRKTTSVAYSAGADAGAGASFGSRHSTFDVLGYIDFDDLLPLVGSFGAYQKKLFALMIPFMFFVAFVYLGQIFVTLVPEQHWCYVPALKKLSKTDARNLAIPQLSDGSFSKCTMYETNYTEVLQQNLTVNTSWPEVPCTDGWVYIYSDIPYATIATEDNWVCERDKYDTYAFIAFFGGSIFGGLLYGSLADNVGRVPALVSANLVGFLGGLITAMTSSFIPFLLLRFFTGFAFDSCYTVMYIILMEYVGPAHRTFVGNMSIGLFYTPAACVVPWIAYGIANWRLFLVVTSAPLFLVVFAQCIIPESARWLVSVGKIDEAMEILHKISIVNRKSVPIEIFDRFYYCCQRFYLEEQNNRTFSVFHVCKWRNLLRITLTLIVIWMAICLVYDGHVRAINTVGADIFFISSIASITELPAAIVCVLTLDRCGRRWNSFFHMVACGVFSIIAGLMTHPYSMAAVAIAGRFFANICYNIGLQYAAEILPTVVRAQGLASIHIMGYVATLLSPAVVYLARITPSLPLFILGGLSILGGILSLLLPETLNRELPQTLSDGNKFGKNEPFCSSPCGKLRKTDSKMKRFNKRHWHSGSSLREMAPASYRSGQLARVAVRGANKKTSLSANAHDHSGDEAQLEREEYTHFYKTPKKRF